jgi:lariat debranching enzyme
VLGSPALATVMESIKPTFWFAAHHHIQYSAVKNHIKNPNEILIDLEDELESTPHSTQTQFLALDKCRPHQEYLKVRKDLKKIMEIETNETKVELSFDFEWLSILKATIPYLPLSYQSSPFPNATIMKQYF